jgi:hypothetical protein
MRRLEELGTQGEEEMGESHQSNQIDPISDAPTDYRTSQA